jgi:hypothetical protein
MLLASEFCYYKKRRFGYLELIKTETIAECLSALISDLCRKPIEGVYAPVPLYIRGGGLCRAQRAYGSTFRIELLAESKCNQKQNATIIDAKTDAFTYALRRSCYKRGPQQLIK